MGAFPAVSLGTLGEPVLPREGRAWPLLAPAICWRSCAGLVEWRMFMDFIRRISPERLHLSYLRHQNSLRFVGLVYSRFCWRILLLLPSKIPAAWGCTRSFSAGSPLSS